MASVDAGGARLFYLTPGGNHDGFFLQTLRDCRFDILYVHLVDGMGKYCPSDVRSINLGYRPIRGGGPHRAIARMVLKVPYVARVKRLLREFRPDLLHADWIPTTGFWAALSGHHPFHLFCFGSDVRFRASRSRWMRRVAAFTLARADAVTCDNEHTRSLLSGRYGVPAHRLHCFSLGVDLSLFRSDRESRGRVRRDLGWEDSRIVLFARKLEEIYAPETFVRAFAHAHREEPAIRAVVAGDGPLMRGMRELAEDLGVGRKVVFLGEVERADLARVMAACDVMVSCPVDDGSSNAVLEAMACGLPVVASDLPAMREWIVPGANGVLCAAGDVEGFSAGLLRVLRDEAFRRRASGANRAVVEARADRVRSRALLAQVYLDLLAEARAPQVRAREG
ncbi:MAG: glycosyltransferase family 4 protein [Nitrospirae bacterium]|nr:glycosyltransferase family 4 protein [Nitrospirota bacterium]